MVVMMLVLKLLVPMVVCDNVILIFLKLITPAQVSRAILHALTCPRSLLPSSSCVRVTVQQGGY